MERSDNVVSKIEIIKRGEEETLQRDEFLKLPISKRVPLISRRHVRFYNEKGGEIEPQVAIASMREINLLRNVFDLGEKFQSKQEFIITQIVRCVGGEGAYNLVSGAMVEIKVTGLASAEDMETLGGHLLKTSGMASIVGQILLTNSHTMKKSSS